MHNLGGTDVLGTVSRAARALLAVLPSRPQSRDDRRPQSKSISYPARRVRVLCSSCSSRRSDGSRQILKTTPVLRRGEINEDRDIGRSVYSFLASDLTPTQRRITPVTCTVAVGEFLRMSEAAREIKVSRSPVKHQSPEISVRDQLHLPLLIQQALNCPQAGDIAGALGILAAAPATARDGERNTARHADPIRFIAVRQRVCAVE